jgi:hypothetical protein
MLTAVAVDTEVLGGVQAEAGLTEPMGVPGKTSSLVSENAQVVTDVGPPLPHEDDTTQTGRYQAPALKDDPELGALNSAVALLTRAELMSQNINS